MLFSLMKISCFHVKAHLAFHWCLYNKMIYYMASSLSGQDTEFCAVIGYPSRQNGTLLHVYGCVSQGLGTTEFTNSIG